MAVDIIPDCNQVRERRFPHSFMWGENTMKTSVAWLKNYVDIPWAPKELARRLTGAGLEVEGIVQLGVIPDGVVVAEILERKPHPNADKLSVCQVSTGTGEPLQIVCGAPNCDAGRRVPLAVIGTKFGDDFTIKKAKLRGVESSGMMCSAQELQLSAESNGLLILPADAPLGTPLAQLIATDAVIDWEVTPNRPDWLSHIGIAREIAAVTGTGPASLRLPPAEVKIAAGTNIADAAGVEVRAPELCPRYTARVIRNVKIGPSPAWLCRALEAVGLRPINNVVDITNYVMLEYGQPLHAFDLAELKSGKVIVRRANPGETLTLLDGKELKLTPDNLLIADAERGVALAGIMGGRHSGIHDATTTVLLESAAFNPSNIRATARKLGLGTDSSHRFERGVSLETVEAAGRRAAALLCELAGGEMLGGVIDVYAQPYQPATIGCRVSRVNAVLGLKLTQAEISGLLARLGLGVAESAPGVLQVTIPHFRLDLKAEIDLVEEVVRIHGLDNIPETVTTALSGGSFREDRHVLIETARNQLLGLGLDEIVNYSMLPLAAATTGTGLVEAELVKLANPISAESAFMRPSLLPFMLQTVAHNIAHNNPDLGLFEIGRVFANCARLPEERWQACLAVTGRRHPERFGAERAEIVDFYDLKGMLAGWLADRRVTGAVFAATAHPAFVKGACAAITVSGVEVAVFGEILPELTKGMRLKTPLFLALAELEALAKIQPPVAKYQPLPQYPASSRDVAMIAPDTLTCGEIRTAILAEKCAFLENVELFDIFADEKALGPGRKSLAFSLTYRHAERTLTDGETTAAHETIKTALAKKLGVTYR